jgi:hypothetical protein
MAKHLDRHYCGRCHLGLKLDAKAIAEAQELFKKKQAALKAKQATDSKDDGAAADAKKGKKGKKGK